jgi:hypothetical protein
MMTCAPTRATGHCIGIRGQGDDRRTDGRGGHCTGMSIGGGLAAPV